jgi:hypothetical protein
MWRSRHISRFNPEIQLERLKKTTKNFTVRIAGNTNEIRNGHLPNKITENYCYPNLLCYDRKLPSECQGSRKFSLGTIDLEEQVNRYHICLTDSWLKTSSQKREHVASRRTAVGNGPSAADLFRWKHPGGHWGFVTIPRLHIADK